MKNRVIKADEKLTKNAQKELDLIYFATCLVLFQEYGWGKKRIKRLVDVAGDIFTECGSDQNMSLVQMCSNETNIELRNADNKSWEDAPYLNEAKWKEFEPKFYKMPLQKQRAYMLRVKACMDKWKKPIILSSVILALHRKEGWGFTRISKILPLIEDCCNEYNNDERKLLEAVNTTTGLKYSYTRSHELVLLNAREIEGESE